MQSKAAQIAALLRGKTVFYVNIETPDGQDSITETTLESPERAPSGIAILSEGKIPSPFLSSSKIKLPDSPKRFIFLIFRHFKRTVKCRTGITEFHKM
jgi:hypothetical protein